MYIAIKKLTGSKVIKKSTVEKVMHDNTIVYCNSLRRLYELGFSRSPFYIDEFDFRLACIQEFENDLNFIKSSLNGELMFTEMSVKYASMVSNNELFKEVITSYKDYIVSKENLYACEKVLTTILKEDKEAKIKRNILFNEGIADKSQIKLPMEVFMSDSNNDIRCISIADAIMGVLYEEVGLSKEIVDNYRSENKPLFIKGITFNEEVEFANAILLGEIALKGDYGEQLIDKIAEYYNDNYSARRFTSSTLLFEKLVYNKAINSYIQIIKTIREEQSKDGYTELYITADKIYFQGYNDKKERHKETIQDLTVGMYTNIKTIDVFKGVSGVFSVDTGVPVFLTDYGLVYSIEIPEYYDEKMEDVCKRLKCNTVRNFLRAFSQDEDVVDLAVALVNARCGETETRLNRCYNFENVDVFKNKCRDALQLFEDRSKLV